MNSENKQLLEKVTKERLLRAHEGDPKAMDEALKAVDRLNEVAKIENASNEQLRSEAAKEKEAKWSRWIKIGEIGAMALVIPLLDYLTKDHFVRNVCNFEKDYNFSTSAGRSVSGLFRFKK